ncbi:unnamed protein product [Nippostrongylus brasiliensis]|uniref:PPM-type phosphatase domain-containing protein n=1 Tax=Nippostrongylus brasiliensis TaxID=27835 RepID=A0A0N4XK80_NIPBR|nr:unnamed protein product [Nippostrongylus brasiliensis]
MTTEEYVYVLLAMRSQAFGEYCFRLCGDKMFHCNQKVLGQAGTGQATLKSGLTPFWEDTVNNNADGLDAAAKSAAKRMVVIDVNADIGNQSYLSQFQDSIMKRVREPPLSCSTKECLTNDNETVIAFRSSRRGGIQLHTKSYFPDGIFFETAA